MKKNVNIMILSALILVAIMTSPLYSADQAVQKELKDRFSLRVDKESIVSLLDKISGLTGHSVVLHCLSKECYSIKVSGEIQDMEIVPGIKFLLKEFNHSIFKFDNNVDVFVSLKKNDRPKNSAQTTKHESKADIPKTLHFDERFLSEEYIKQLRSMTKQNGEVHDVVPPGVNSTFKTTSDIEKIVGLADRDINGNYDDSMLVDITPPGVNSPAFSSLAEIEDLQKQNDVKNGFTADQLNEDNSIIPPGVESSELITMSDVDQNQIRREVENRSGGVLSSMPEEGALPDPPTINYEKE